MKNYNVEILFKDKDTNETVFQMNLEDLNSIQENVIKAQIGLNDGEKAEDKIVKDPDNKEELLCVKQNVLKSCN